MIWNLIDIFGAIVILIAAWFAWRSVRRLNQRIKEFQEELEARRNQGGPIDSYSMMAGLLHGFENQDTERPPQRKRTML